ncbi:cation:proton antiporter [Chthonobacter albigriseus]|uniref:cation:proton antiporter n=1 Tax=Chthonobacter albigriseus TaxID=1683161 RepID=UPI0015EEF9FC|nr:cation:proton antiporter [Chthonobacter albigriseus]
MDTPSLVLVFAALLTAIALTEPVAQAIRLPASVVLAATGVGVGLIASLLIYGGLVPPDASIALFFADPPISSDLFIYVFLPTLLFHSALGMDMHQLADDAVPVLLLAVIAVVLATLVIGLALWPVSGVPLVACLLLGCVVATTDPVAVIGIFKDVGAPERLVRLVEGESLLNDAAAITMFVVFTAILTQVTALDGTVVALDFVVIPLGGALVGFVVARAFAGLIAFVGDNRLVEVSLSLALPYLVYPVAEQIFHLSGVIAVVTAGLTLASTGPARMTPAAWKYLKGIWDQLAFWASTLIFLLAAILIPRLIGGITWFDGVALVVLVIASLVARWLILFVVMPLLAAAKWSPPVSRDYRLVILWGGLRGAATLALALAVTENQAMPAEVTRFVAVLATGFTLFTMLVQGLTMRPLMKSLGLNRLTPVDEVLRDQAIAVAYTRVADRIEKSAEAFRLDAPLTEAAVATYRARGRSARNAADGASVLSLDDRIALGLVAIAGREREIVLSHAGDGTVSAELVERLLAEARSRIDGARLKGRAGYTAAAAEAIAFTWRDRLAYRLHRVFGYDRLLARRLADRTEELLLHRIVLEELAPFARDDIGPVFGAEVQDAIEAALDERRADVERGLDALRLQYPDYARALETRFLERLGLAVELTEVTALAENGLINAEVERDLLQEVASGQLRAAARPALDLGLDTRALVDRQPLFAGFGPAERAALAQALRPVFVYPGHRLIRKGERGDAAYLISSGAVEVDTGRAVFRLGRGDVVGEMALLTGQPRSGDVTALGFCALLRLGKADFDRVLEGNPALKRTVEEIAEERGRVNREG